MRRSLSVGACCSRSRRAPCTLKPLRPVGTVGALPAATFGGSGIPNDSVMMNTVDGVTWD